MKETNENYYDNLAIFLCGYISASLFVLLKLLTKLRLLRNTIKNKHFWNNDDDKEHFFI